MADVFISYHVKSASKIVREIAAALEAREIGDGPARRKITCWYSERDMSAGEDFSRIVPQQIKTCRVFLPVVNQGALGSRHVEREFIIADKRFTGPDSDTFKTLPYRVEDCDSDSRVGYYLLNIQRIEGIPHTRASVEELVSAVVKAVESVEKKQKEQEEELVARLLREIQTLQEKVQDIQKGKKKFTEEPHLYTPEPLISKAGRVDELDANAGISSAEKNRRKKIQEEFERARLIERAKQEQSFTGSLPLGETVSITVASVDGIIGRDRHSNVYRAELVGSHEVVALKIDYRNLEREYPHVLEKVKALRKIENEHIQRLIEFVPDLEKNRSYIVLDYIPGVTLQQTLYDRTQSGGAPFPQARVLNWTVQLLDALEYLHENKLLHGDINLSNIMLRPKKGSTKNGEEEHEICLIDFNWSAPDLPMGETRTEIKTDSSEGMFFEVSDAEAFRRGILRDIYHVGAVMYQLLTGEVPDAGKGRTELMSEAKASDVDEKRRTLRDCGVTDDVAEVILKALSVNPNDRYGSAGEMRNALVRILLRIKPRLSHRLRILLTIIAAILLFLAGWSMISVGVYQLGIHNGVEAETSLQDAAHESGISALPSVSIKNGEISPHEDVSHQ